MAPAGPEHRWWPGGGWRHGDAFPLPVPMDIFPSGAPRYVRRCWRERQGRQRLYEDCVGSLNQLAAATSNSDHFRRDAPSRAPPTTVQANMLHGVHRRIVNYGPVPVDLTPSGALQELLNAKDLYGQEPRHLASYVFRRHLSSATCAPASLPRTLAAFSLWRRLRDCGTSARRSSSARRRSLTFIVIDACPDFTRTRRWLQTGGSGTSCSVACSSSASSQSDVASRAA